MKWQASILIFLLLSCGEKEEQSIELRDIIEYDEESSIRDSGVVSDGSTVYLKTFESLGIGSVMLTEKTYFPERFGPDSTISLSLLTESDTLGYFRWIFSDSAKTTNAFFNWMDCFGPDCRTFSLGERANFNKTGFLIMVGKQDLIYIEGENIDFDRWEAFHDSINEYNKWSWIIEQRNLGKARWYKTEEGKKINYEQ